MAVVINEMDSTVETQGGAAAPSAPPELSEDDFRAKYGEYVRALVRDELERWLRSAAD